MNFEKSCGALVYTREDGEIRYVIQRSLEGVYGFPKGHMEPGETEEETALREIREEAGLTVRLIPGYRETVEYPLPKKPGTMKRVVYFLAEYENQPLVPQPEEISSAVLMEYEDAMVVLPYEYQKRMLARARDLLVG